MNQYYRDGLVSTAGIGFRMPRFVSDQTKALSMMWHGAGRGGSVRSRYQDGIHGIDRQPRSAGFTDNAVDTIMSVFHILLLIGGAWLFVNVLINI